LTLTGWIQREPLLSQVLGQDEDVLRQRNCTLSENPSLFLCALPDFEVEIPLADCRSNFLADAEVEIDALPLVSAQEDVYM